MSDYSAALLGDDAPPIDVRPRVIAELAGDGASSTTTYCYRTALGVRGTTPNSQGRPACLMLDCGDAPVPPSWPEMRIT
jgi:hypothetical protein